jgi:hypothetical protein
MDSRKFIQPGANFPKGIANDSKTFRALCILISDPKMRWKSDARV